MARWRRHGEIPARETVFTFIWNAVAFKAYGIRIKALVNDSSDGGGITADLYMYVYA